MCLARGVPFDGNAMCGILRGNATTSGHVSRSELFEPNQADAGHALSVDELRSKGTREHVRQDSGINVEIDQDTTVNDALHDWDFDRIAPQEKGSFGRLITGAREVAFAGLADLMQ